jgi:oligopeptide/dipeptide ABC transporter ATP-binding protein
MTAEKLTVRDLHVAVRRSGQQLVRGVSFDVEPGSSFGFVGETGSGKSLTCRAVISLLPPGLQASGGILYGGNRLSGLSKRELAGVRGRTISMIFQDPLAALNPMMRVGDAIVQVLRAHARPGRGGLHRGASAREAIELLERVGISDPARRSRLYPHEFSGGMRQRVAIAMALAARPSLLIADEPTSALDVVVQAGILSLLDQLRREDGVSLILVSHDFGVISGACDQLAVMYAGQIVEQGPTLKVLSKPAHPYTAGLLASLPQPGRTTPLVPITGSVPDAASIGTGCAFAPRCHLVTDKCRGAPIPLLEVAAPDRVSRCLRWADVREPVGPRHSGEGRHTVVE